MNKTANLTILTDLKLFKESREETRQTILRNTRVIRLAKGKTLFRIRDRVDNIYLVASGFVVLERESEDHGGRNVFLLGKDELINEVILDYSTASVNCKAIADADIIAFPREIFLSCMKEDFGFNQYVIRSMAIKIRKMYHMIESSTKMTRLDHMVASRIWKFAKDFGVQKEGYIQLPFELRITTLAGFVGSNRETVSRIIKKISEERILSIEKGVCKIYDADRLKDYGKIE